MKNLTFAVVMALALVAMDGCYYSSARSSGWSNRDLKAVTNLVHTGTIPADLKSLDVNNAFGAIRVTGADTGTFGWSQKLTVRARAEADLQPLVDHLLCRAQLAGDRLKLVVTVPTTPGPHSFISDLEITVPKAVAIQTHDQYGRTEITGLNSNVEAANRFGQIELHDIDGNVRAETSYAALKLSHTGPATVKNQFGAIDATTIRGSLDAETSYATLNARGVDGAVRLRNQFGKLQAEEAGEADVKTSYAELSLKNIRGDARLVNQFGRVTAEAISGSVKADTSYGPMDITGPGANFVCNNQFGGISLRATSAALTNLQARTSYGDMTVRLPAALKPAVQAHTTYGDIESDFPVLMKPRGQDPFSGLPPDTPRVNLQNQNGKIRVVSE